MRVKVCPLGELPKGQCRVIKQEHTYIALIHHGEAIYAINDTCPHLGGSLGTGWLTEEGTIVCPWHGWEFRICDGKGVWPQGVQIETYPVEVENGEVFVVLDGKLPKTR